MGLLGHNWHRKILTAFLQRIPRCNKMKLLQRMSEDEKISQEPWARLEQRHGNVVEDTGTCSGWMGREEGKTQMEEDRAKGRRAKVSCESTKRAKNGSGRVSKIVIEPQGLYFLTLEKKTWPNPMSRCVLFADSVDGRTRKNGSSKND